MQLSIELKKSKYSRPKRIEWKKKYMNTRKGLEQVQ